MCRVVALGFLIGVPLRAECSGNGSASVGLDHVIVAVNDLEAAARRYRDLGFSLKPGRPHANGIRNQHVKFPDGIEIELLTAAEARDDLTAQYRRHLDNGDGPAFFALYAPDRDAVAAQLDSRDLRYRRNGSLITFPDPDPLATLFFSGRNHSPTDRPEHFAHANAAQTVIALWLAGDLAPERELLALLGGVAEAGEVRVPDLTSAEVVTIEDAEVYLLPASRQFTPGRKIVGVTISVRSLDAARAALKIDLPETAVMTDHSLFLPPSVTHGIWIELRETGAVGVASAGPGIVDPGLRDIDARIELELEETGTPGAALVVARNGRIIHARGYGLADAEKRRFADAETVWPIASVTKVLTSVAVMQLVEAGELSLDDPVAAHIDQPRVPDEYDRPITVADLLRHTSGLDELPGRRVARAANVRPLRQFLAGHLVQYRPPGTFTSYSSYGMSLAGLLVEELTGSSYAEYVRARIFRPLGMHRSRIMMEAGDERGVAAPYEIEDGRARRIDYEWYSTPPVASAVSSATDMGRLLIGLTEATILSPATLHSMMTTQATLHPDVPGWGYGFQLDSVNGRAVAEHGGDIGGFAGLLVVVPEERLGFFIVHHGEGSSLRFTVRRMLLDHLLPATAVPPTGLQGVDLTPYAGSYRASFSCHTCAEGPPVPEFDVTIEKGALRLWGERWVPIGEDLFAREDGRARLGFVRDDAGRVIALTGGSWRVGERITSGEPSK